MGNARANKYELRLIKAYAACGLTAREIWEALRRKGISKCQSWVSHAMSENFISRTKYPRSKYAHPCWFCKQYFLKKRPQSEIAKEIGISDTGINDIYALLFPLANFLKQGGLHRSPVWAFMTDQRVQQAKDMHLHKGYGRREIERQLKCPYNLRTFLRKQPWYNTTTASAHNTVAAKKPWRRVQREREQKRKANRSRQTSDLPLFAHAAKMRNSCPRAEMDQEKLDRVRAREMGRYNSNPNFHIKNNLRKRLNRFVTREQRVKGFETRSGCTVPQLRRWIESQFQEGMTWESKGKWHIDHIVPCSLFDLTDPKQQKICFNWRNLQPMWGTANIAKGNNIDRAFECMESHPNRAAMCELKAMIAVLPQFKIAA